MALLEPQWTTKKDTIVENKENSKEGICQTTCCLWENVQQTGETTSRYVYEHRATAALGS